MKTSLRLFLAFALLTYGYTVLRDPRPHVKAKVPVVRYHGYELNQKAIHTAKLFTVLIAGEGFATKGRGTGILLDPTHVLTCAHVALMGSEETWVYFYPGYVSARGKTVFANRSEDLAILELDVPANGAPVPVFQENHFDGEPVTIMGNILGCMKWFVGYGIISGETGQYLLTDGLVRGGDSGGPWINEKGEIVAISDWGLESGDGKELGISGGVSAETINKFLKAWKNPNLLDILMGL